MYIETNVKTATRKVLNFLSIHVVIRDFGYYLIARIDCYNKYYIRKHNTYRIKE